MQLKTFTACLLFFSVLTGCASKNIVCVENTTDFNLNYTKVRFLEQGWTYSWSDTDPGATRCYETNNPTSGNIEVTVEQINSRITAQFTAKSQTQPLVFRVRRDAEGHLFVESDSAEATWDDDLDLANRIP